MKRWLSGAFIKNSEIVISVSGNGTVMPKAEPERIVERLDRADAARLDGGSRLIMDVPAMSIVTALVRRA